MGNSGANAAATKRVKVYTRHTLDLRQCNYPHRGGPSWPGS